MHRPSVGEWALRAVLLHVHAKETHVHAVNLLKGEKCFGSVGKGLRHFARVHKPVITKTNQILTRVNSISRSLVLGYCHLKRDMRICFELQVIYDRLF